MCRGSDRPLPTKKTALYTTLVQTILIRYLTKHPKYKSTKLNIRHFTDLPSDIYSIFMELTELAYKDVTSQQQIFKDREAPIEHLGFMNAATELYSLHQGANFSYTFLHLSLQEFLAAYHITQMDTHTQERLLQTMFKESHMKNTAMFLSAMTKLTCSKGNKKSF